jgi:hypothetical protein
MSEASILKTVHLAVGSMSGVRLFRNQVGQGVAGQVVKRQGDLLLVRGNPVTMGLCVGSSDLVGWRSITVTPDMVGTILAQFAAIEVKTPTGRTSPSQIKFLDVVSRAGGLSAVVRSPEEATRIFIKVMP